MAKQIRQFQVVARLLLKRLITQNDSDWWKPLERFQDELQLAWETQFPDQCPSWPHHWQVFGVKRIQKNDRLKIEIHYWDCELERFVETPLYSLVETTQADAEALLTGVGVRIEWIGDRNFTTKRGPGPETKTKVVAALENLIESADSYQKADRCKKPPAKKQDKQLTQNQEIEILDGWDYEQEQNKTRPADKTTREQYAKSHKISLDQFERIQDKHRKTPRI